MCNISLDFMFQGSLGGDLRRGQHVAQAEVAQQRRECRDADRLGISYLGLAGWTSFWWRLDFTVMIVQCPLHIVISKTHHYRYTARTKHRWSLDSSTRKDFRSWRASDKSYQHFELRFVFKITFCFSVLLLTNWIK